MDQGTKQAFLGPAARKNPKANIQAAAPGGSASPQDPVRYGSEGTVIYDGRCGQAPRDQDDSEAAPATSLQETAGPRTPAAGPGSADRWERTPGLDRRILRPTPILPRFV